jgi:hypothetical protein
MKLRRLHSCHRMTAIAGLILLSLTGCKYDRSFMNMDSNSGSPFFGLQLAVDSGSRPPLADERTEDIDRAVSPRNNSQVIPGHSEPESGDQPPMLFTRTATAQRNGFESTSELREWNSDVRYSLQAPVTDESLHAQTIDLRLSAF